MEKLKLGGFPPLIKKTTSKDKEVKKDLKPQFFSTVQKTNINIREILSEKTDLFENNKTVDSLEELDEI